MACDKRAELAFVVAKAVQGQIAIEAQSKECDEESRNDQQGPKAL
jgi:hypothetical protein